MTFIPGTMMLKDRQNNVGEVTRYGQLITAQRKDLVLCRFEYNNSSYDVSTSVSGTGAALNSNSQAVASTGASTGTCVFTTVRSITYKPAHEVYCYGSCVFTTGEANTYQRWGVYDANDGFFIGYEGASFGFTLRKGAVDTTIAKSSWNKDKCDGTGASGFTLDPTKNNQYKIGYGWLGIGPATLSVYASELLGWVICHVIDYSNLQTTPTITSPNNNIRWEVGRTSGSGAITLAIGCVGGGVMEGGHAHAGHRVFASRRSVTIAPGTTHLATFHNKTTFQSKTNKISGEAVFGGFSTDGTKPVEFLFYRNASLSGGSYSDIDTNNSVMEVSSAGTITGGTFELGVPLGKSEGRVLDLAAGHIHLELFPGETMSIVAVSTGASDVVISLRWEEYFA